MEQKPKTTQYKGYNLIYCWCGHPEMRWMIYYGWECLHVAQTLKEAKAWIDANPAPAPSL